MCVFFCCFCVQFSMSPRRRRERASSCVALWRRCTKRTNKKSCSRGHACQKFNQGCLLFFGRKRKTIFLNLSWIHKSLLRAYYKHTHTQRERRKEREEKKENRHRENRLNNKNDAPTISDASMGRTSSLPTLIFDFQR